MDETDWDVLEGRFPPDILEDYGEEDYCAQYYSGFLADIEDELNSDKDAVFARDFFQVCD